MVGQLMPIQPFQERLTRDVFALDERGRRKVRRALIGMARKNGKTKMVAWWALALLLENAGGEVIGAAGKRDQARLLLDSAKDFVAQSSWNGVPLEDNYFELKRNAIYCPETDSVYRVISSEAYTEHGLNPSVILADELHAWRGDKGRDLWETLTTAQGATVWENPLLIAITTAGEPGGVWQDMYEKGRAIERGALEPDPSFYFRWYEADSDLPLDSEEAWRQANPGLGTIKSREILEEQSREAMRPGGEVSEYAFRRLHLNQPTAAHERWVPYKRWVACGNLEPNIPEGAPVYVGVDAALKRDTFAVSVVHLDDRDPPHAHVKAEAFTPAVQGGYIDPSEVLTHLLGLAQTYRVEEVRYDPAYMGLLVSKAEDRGLPMEDMAQTPTNMARAAERLQRFILDERLRHGMDKTLDEHMSAVAVKTNDKGVRISKGKSGGPVDTVVALAMALDAAVEHELDNPVGDHFALRL